MPNKLARAASRRRVRSIARRFLLAVGSDDDDLPVAVVVGLLGLVAASLPSVTEERRDGGRTRPGRLKLLGPPPLLGAPLIIVPLPAVLAALVGLLLLGLVAAATEEEGWAGPWTLPLVPFIPFELPVEAAAAVEDPPPADGRALLLVDCTIVAGINRRKGTY